jgi:hypothetical protein
MGDCENCWAIFLNVGFIITSKTVEVIAGYKIF